METAYTIANGTNGIIIAVVVGFISIFPLGCLAFTIFVWRRIRSPQKKYEPSNKLKISHWERRLLGAHFSLDSNLEERVRALRVYQRRKSRIYYVLLIIGIIYTAISAIFLLILLSAFCFQQSWLSMVISANWHLMGPYIFLPLFIILMVAVVIWIFYWVWLLFIKDSAPIIL